MNARELPYWLVKFEHTQGHQRYSFNGIDELGVTKRIIPTTFTTKIGVMISFVLIKTTMRPYEKTNGFPTSSLCLLFPYLEFDIDRANKRYISY